MTKAFMPQESTRSRWSAGITGSRTVGANALRTRCFFGASVGAGGAVSGDVVKSCRGPGVECSRSEIHLLEYGRWYVPDDEHDRPPDSGNVGHSFAARCR